MDTASDARCYRRGVEAMETQNRKLAAEMFRQCARISSDNLMYHQLVRSCENRLNRNPGV